MNLPDYPEFERELAELINKHSIENGSNTPDFILAKYLTNCLLTFSTAVLARERWCGRDPHASPAVGAIQSRPASLTLEEFRATGENCDDLGAVLDKEQLMGSKGRLYAGSLWIEELPVNVWPGSSHEAACTLWRVRLGVKDRINSLLKPLERLLYDWAIAEGRIPAAKD